MHPFLRPTVALAAIAAAAMGHSQSWLQNQVNWSTFRTGITCNVQQSSVRVIDSQNDFLNYWRSAMGQSADTAPKNVDWTKDRLVAVHLGQRTSGGYTVEVRNVEKSGTVGVLRVIEHTPMDGQWVSQSVTSPFVIIRVGREVTQVRANFEKIKGFPMGGATITGANTYIRPGYNQPGAYNPASQADWGNLDSGNCAIPAAAGVYTLDNDYDWRSFYGKAHGTDPSYGAPQVDWSKYRLVVVQLGERPSSRYRVIVNAVEPNGSQGVIRGVEETPIPGSWVTKRPSYPYTVIRVPRSLGNFKLSLEKREGPGNVTHVH